MKKQRFQPLNVRMIGFQVCIEDDDTVSTWIIPVLGLVVKEYSADGGEYEGLGFEYVVHSEGNGDEPVMLSFERLTSNVLTRVFYAPWHHDEDEVRLAKYVEPMAAELRRQMAQRE